MFYFNSTAVSMLICLVFTLAILTYLLSLKQKSPQTKALIIFFVGGFILDTGFLYGAIFPIPAGAYHRFLTIPGAFLGVIVLSQFAYRFPSVSHVKESRIVLGVGLVAGALSIGEFVFKAIHTQPEFFFEGSLFNYPNEMGRRIALVLMIHSAWFVVVIIRKARRHQGEERRALMQLGFAMLIPTLAPALANVLHQQGKIDHLAFEQAFVTLTLLGYFFITIVFINNAVERTSFMIKIVGISLVTILMVVQGLSTLVTSSQEKAFDQTSILEGRNQVLLPEGQLASDHVGYVLSYTDGHGAPEVRVVFNRDNVTFNLPAAAAALKQAGESGALEKRLNRQTRPHSAELFYGYIIKAGPGRFVEVGYPLTVYRAFIHDAAKRIGYMLIGVTAVILILYPIFFSRSLVRPLNSLLSGVGEVNTGNLTVKIPVLVQDEIGYLSESFNKMVRSILEAKNELQRYAETLEDKVKERTREVTEKMEEIQGLKVQQDGDYYLTSLIEKPLETNWNKSQLVQTSFFIEQKKKFSFRARHAELGGDLCITGNLRFGAEGQRHVVFLNGDAMGKSMQGAGGAIVLGTTMNNIMARSAGANLTISPAEWLTGAWNDLHNVFKTFDGLMLVSAVLGVINEDTGQVWYFNAEHPWMVLLRKGKASFVEKELMLRKLGSASEFTFAVQEFRLEPGDVLIAGSDGRDDINFSSDPAQRVINEDIELFLDYVESTGGDIPRIVEKIRASGDITDDLSLLKIGFHLKADVPGDGQVLFEKGSRAIAEGNIDEGISLLESAVIAAPDHAGAAGLLARTLFGKEDFERAAQRTLEYLEVKPTDGDAWFQLSLCYRHMHEFEKACGVGERLFQLQPDRAANLINLADSYRMLSEYGKARAHLNEALRLVPDSSPGQKLDVILKNRGH